MRLETKIELIFNAIKLPLQNAYNINEPAKIVVFYFWDHDVDFKDFSA